MTAENYKKKSAELLAELAKNLRAWTHSNSFFYIDGVFDPETWFNHKNKFRPLFILKEVHEKNIKDAVREAKKQDIKTIENCIDFVAVGERGSDPWKGEGMWKRLGILASAMFKLCENQDEIPEYNAVMEESEKVTADMETKHQKVCRKIAVINLKKLGGGKHVESQKSIESIHYACHAACFHDELMQQISLIQPDVIVCCGRNVVSQCLGVDKEEYITILRNGLERKIPVINGYHPSQTSTEKYYYNTLKQMQERGIFDLKA